MADVPELQVTDGELLVECADIEVDGKRVTRVESTLAAMMIRRRRLEHSRALTASEGETDG